MILALDELPTLYLPDLPKWINEFRSNGFVALLGYQNFAQLQHIYGRDLFAGTLCRLWDQWCFSIPRTGETANEFSGYLGEKEVRLFTRSRSHGRYGGQSRSEQVQRVPLMTADQILKAEAGGNVSSSIRPTRGGGEGSVPLRVRVRLSKRERWVQDRSTELWHSIVKQKLIQRCQMQTPPTDLE